MRSGGLADTILVNLSNFPFAESPFQRLGALLGLVPCTTIPTRLLEKLHVCDLLPQGGGCPAGAGVRCTAASGGAIDLRRFVPTESSYKRMRVLVLLRGTHLDVSVVPCGGDKLLARKTRFG